MQSVKIVLMIAVVKIIASMDLVEKDQRKTGEAITMKG